MPTYTGRIGPRGKRIVTVDGEKLDPATHLMNLEDEFMWGVPSAKTTQLGLAILYRHTSDGQDATLMCQEFTKNFLLPLRTDEGFEFDSDAVEEALARSRESKPGIFYRGRAGEGSA